jgi:large repetitive protein
MRTLCRLALVVALLLVPGALFGLTGPSGPEIRVAVAGAPTFPLTAVFPDGGFVVAWTTGAKTSVIHARLFDASGAPASGELRLVQPANQWLDGLALTTDGGFVVVWEQPHPKNRLLTSVFARKFDRRANPLTAAFQVHDASPLGRYSARVAGTADGGFVVAWAADSPAIPSPGFSIGHTDAVARFFHSDGTAAGPAFPLFKNTDPANGDGILPAAMAVAPDGVVTIVSDCICDQPGLLLQSFASDGSVGDLDLIPPDCFCRDELQLYPSLSMAPDGSFVVAWVTNRGLISANPDLNQPSAVRARRFAADGTGLGDVLQVNQHGRLTTTPLAATLADGSFVIAWTDQNGRDGSLSGVFARAYDANGVTSGPDLQLDVKATGNQFLTSIAAGARAVAVWVNADTRIAARLLVSH